MRISGQTLKQRGAKVFSEALKDSPSAIVQIRGNDRFVVLPIEVYDEFREYELTKALEENSCDLKNGNYHTDSVGNHIKRISA
jgi:hypothetical protein